LKFSKNLKAQDVDLQVRNPNKLTWRQHFLPFSCMKHFTNNEGKIWVTSTKNKSCLFRKLKRYEPGVVAARAYTQQVEKTLNDRVENEFFNIQKQILRGKRFLILEEHRVISSYLALWRSRYLYREHNFEIIPLNGVSPSTLTDDQREKLEKNNYLMDAGRVTEVNINSMNLLRAYKWYSKELKDVKWSVHEVSNGMEVLLPNYSSNVPYVHISPTLFLLPVSMNFNTNNYSDITSLNLQLIFSCGDVFYCRDIQKLVCG
jgi:hypothetical protein